MRTVHTTICVCLAAALALPLGARTARKSPSELTVILDFRGPHSRISLNEMKREAGLILLSSGVRLTWGILGENPEAVYNDLAVMTFHGDCEFAAAPPRYDELGPYAMTHIDDGDVLPFGEVDCDRVISSAREAMSPEDYARGDQLVGRAMGRVVAHELVHMLTGSTIHGVEGVEKPALSGRQLIAASLPLSVFDIDRVRRIQ